MITSRVLWALQVQRLTGRPHFSEAHATYFVVHFNQQNKAQRSVKDFNRACSLNNFPACHFCFCKYLVLLIIGCCQHSVTFTKIAYNRNSGCLSKEAPAISWLKKNNFFRRLAASTEMYFHWRDVCPQDDSVRIQMTGKTSCSLLQFFFIKTK